MTAQEQVQQLQSQIADLQEELNLKQAGETWVTLANSFLPRLLSHDAVVAQLQAKDSQLANANAQLQTLRNALATAEARINELSGIVPYDPQLIKSSVFRKRITADDWLWLEAQFAPLATRLKQVLSVHIQSVELLAGIAAIRQHPDCPISPGEWGRILAPAANREEAYVEEDEA
jgi:chaperonin cofactor prefoldin